MSGDAPGKPLPVITPVSAPYWEAARARRLEIQRCQDCRRWIHFPDVRCPACGSDRLAFERVRGTGAVSTFTVVHRTFVPGFADDAPYAVAWVDLDEQEGLRVFADVVECAPDDVHIGKRVEVVFTERDGWGPIPSFRPSPAG